MQDRITDTRQACNGEESRPATTLASTRAGKRLRSPSSGKSKRGSEDPEALGNETAPPSKRLRRGSRWNGSVATVQTPEEGPAHQPEIRVPEAAQPETPQSEPQQEADQEAPEVSVSVPQPEFELETPIRGLSTARGPSKGTPDTVAVLRDIVKTLNDIPPGEIAYGAPIPDAPIPKITVDGFGELDPSSLTLGSADLDRLIQRAKELRIKAMGSEWMEIPRMPTWLFLSNYLTIDDKAWDCYVNQIADKSGKFLGFKANTLVPILHGMYLWEENSIWRCYHSRREDPSRVGTLLVTLNNDYEAGGIAVGYENKDLFFDHAPESQNHFFIASHYGVNYDILPVTKGYRLGLSYELHLPGQLRRQSYVQKLTSFVNKRDENLRTQIGKWASEVGGGLADHHSLVFVLDSDYSEVKNISLQKLTPEDRARAVALQHAAVKRYGKYTLQLNFIKIEASVKTYTQTKPVFRFKALKAVDLAGDPVPGVSLNMKDFIVEEGKHVYQSEMFLGGATTADLGHRMKTTAMGRTCLLLELKETA
ncbi:hypothetical protein B0T26DRAFT_745117 [Lasiosphaeria miniovina]|uniref:Uncharacterized protein n=1 Tax=Lasiosphaeria miniovina TaxID=1954250 RepID=A0AA40EF59_9PEZI|nr:uncharacterized protein B0T26DRAFT_745117 [Lasiosphaeria miniovina]KAK0733023.1 hypothetical protein B0T26DRAFT_745117 [Lasiosphaeria miniovina]